MKKSIKIISLLWVLFMLNSLSAQVGINASGNAPDASAMLDVSSNDKGILIPRMTQAERNNISSPATGLLIYQTDATTGFSYYNGSAWIAVTDDTGRVKKINDLYDAKSDDDGSDDGSSVFLGLYAGSFDDHSDNRNVGVGYNALVNNTYGDKNAGIGYGVLLSNTSGFNNTAGGYAAMYLNTEGSANVAYGFQSLYSNTTGQYNTANGYNSLYTNTEGGYNTALGAYALHLNTTKNYNTAIGYAALYTTNEGEHNVAAGDYSLYSNTKGNNNAAIGGSSLYHNTEGSNNTAVGYFSLVSNTLGNGNTALGQGALYGNIDGGYNIASGTLALYKNTSGAGNTAVGNNSLSENKTGNYNTAVGDNAYFTGDNLVNTTCIGYDSGKVSNADNRIEIGNASVSWIGGQVTWSTYSDARYKTNVNNDVAGLDFINRLRPVTYYWNIHKLNKQTHKGKEQNWASKYDIEQIKMTGFLAQEVEQAAKESGYNFSGVRQEKGQNKMYSISYAQFVVPLVKSVQEQQAEIIQLQQSNQKLKQANIRLQNQYDALRQRLIKLEKKAGSRPLQN